MKILRKDDNFKKMADKTMSDIKKINQMIEDGWNYSPKKDYKEFYKGVKTATEIKTEAKKEKKEKVNKMSKEEMAQKKAYADKKNQKGKDKKKKK